MGKGKGRRLFQSRSQRQFQQAKKDLAELIELGKTADPAVMARLLEEPTIKAEQKQMGFFSPAQVEIFKGMLVKGEIYQFYAATGYVPL